MSATPDQLTDLSWCCCTASRNTTTAGTPSSTGSPLRSTSTTPPSPSNSHASALSSTRPHSAAARPSRRRDYRIPELVGDLGALIDASGARQVHLVGHDWGAAVAWAAAAEMPERLATVSPVSVPHPAAFLKSFVTSRQGLASWYMYFFQLPRVPEWLLMRRNGAIATDSLRRGGQIPAAVERDVDAMREPGAMRAAINWYRAMPLSNPRAINQKVSVPTLYVWSDQDIALLPKSAHNTARYVTGEYRFEIMPGVSHWIPDEQPDKLADLLLDWFGTHPLH